MKFENNYITFNKKVQQKILFEDALQNILE